MYREELPKKGGVTWIVGRFKGGGGGEAGGLTKKRGVVFLRGIGTPMHTMYAVKQLTMSVKHLRVCNSRLLVNTYCLHIPRHFVK